MFPGERFVLGEGKVQDFAALVELEINVIWLDVLLGLLLTVTSREGGFASDEELLGFTYLLKVGLVDERFAFHRIVANRRNQFGFKAQFYNYRYDRSGLIL